jgi:rhamnose utilization protein RhaD (predicted bifunctional aldolase and dehydrogenase)
VIANDPLRTAVQRYCTFIARDRLLVQAAGGNVSWKTFDTLWIKASGTWLADAEHRDIFVPVDRRLIGNVLENADYTYSPRSREGYTLRPSIETLLHALMPQKFVLHLHPVNAVAHLVGLTCRGDLDALLGDVFAWDLVDYHKPGAELAQAVHAKLREKPGIQVVLLKNHGVILGSETIQEIDMHLKILNRCLRKQPRPLVTDTISIQRLDKAMEGVPYQFSSDARLHYIATDPELYSRLSDSWAICPDHVVFLGAQAACIDGPSELRIALESFDLQPPFIFVRGIGVLESLVVTVAQKAQLLFYLDVMERISIGQRLNPLGRAEITSLLGWEAEKYRIALNRS